MQSSKGRNACLDPAVPSTTDWQQPTNTNRYVAGEEGYHSQIVKQYEEQDEHACTKGLP